MVNNDVIVKAGFSENKPENKYRLGKAIRESAEKGMQGYIVLINGKEEFFFKPQVTFIRQYKRDIQSFLDKLLLLEKVGFDVEESFKALVELQEEL